MRSAAGIHPGSRSRPLTRIAIGRSLSENETSTCVRPRCTRARWRISSGPARDAETSSARASRARAYVACHLVHRASGVSIGMRGGLARASRNGQTARYASSSLRTCSAAGASDNCGTSTMKNPAGWRTCTRTPSADQRHVRRSGKASSHAGARRHSDVPAERVPIRTRKIRQHRPHRIALIAASEQRVGHERNESPNRQRELARPRRGEIPIQTKRKRNVQEIEDAAQPGVGERHADRRRGRQRWLVTENLAGASG